jgi:hypothetical protein
MACLTKKAQRNRHNIWKKGLENPIIAGPPSIFAHFPNRHPALRNSFHCHHGQIIRSREITHEVVYRSFDRIQNPLRR